MLKIVSADDENMEYGVDDVPETLQRTIQLRMVDENVFQSGGARPSQVVQYFQICPNTHS